MSLPRRSPAAVAVALVFVAAPAAAGQSLNLAVTFNDPGGAFASYYDPITSNLQAAAARWGQVVPPQGNVSLEVTVGFPTDIPRSTGVSVTTSFVHTAGGFNVFEQGAAHEIRTGIDPNGSAADVTINIAPAYLQNNLWFDPRPYQRTDPIPANRTDAVSVFIHELGHAIGFNGWRDGTTGSLPGNYMSTFDEKVVANGGTLYFTGPQAEAVYGGPVPLTVGNYGHVGNAAPGAGSDLIPDMMNGVVFYYQTRYDISPLDAAILADTGLTVNPVPEPASAAWWLGLAACLAGYRRFRSRQASPVNPTPNPVSTPQAVQT